MASGPQASRRLAWTPPTGTASSSGAVGSFSTAATTAVPTAPGGASGRAAIMPREQRERSHSMRWTAMETMAGRRSGLGMRQGPGALAGRALDAAWTMVSTWIRRERRAPGVAGRSTGGCAGTSASGRARSSARRGCRSGAREPAGRRGSSAAAGRARDQRRDEPVHLLGQEGLLEHGAARAGQEVVGGLAERVAGDEGGARAEVRAFRRHPGVGAPRRPSRACAGRTGSRRSRARTAGACASRPVAARSQRKPSAASMPASTRATSGSSSTTRARASRARTALGGRRWRLVRRGLPGLGPGQPQDEARARLRRTASARTSDPPCASAMPRETARPMPVPAPTGLVVKNGSKIRPRTAAGTPGPLSATKISIASPAAPAPRSGCGAARAGAPAPAGRW